MRTTILILAVALLTLCACGGEEPVGPPDSARAAAKRWLEAAVNNDEAALRAVTVDSTEADLMGLVPLVRNAVPQTTGIKWSNTAPRKGDEALTANIKGSLITFELKELGEKHWEVLDVMTSD